MFTFGSGQELLDSRCEWDIDTPGSKCHGVSYLVNLILLWTLILPSKPKNYSILGEYFQKYIGQCWFFFLEIADWLQFLVNLENVCVKQAYTDNTHLSEICNLCLFKYIVIKLASGIILQYNEEIILGWLNIGHMIMDFTGCTLL